MYRPVPEILLKVLKKCNATNYEGYDPYDALNSPLTDLINFGKPGRIFFTHLVKESPINFRNALGIEKERNPMAIALFSLVYYNLYKYANKKDYKRKSEKLAKWLIGNRNENKHIYWGYNFPWQSGRSFLPKYGPCSVVSYFAGEAIRRIKPDRYEEILEKLSGFYLNHLNRLVETDEYLCLSYTPFEESKIVNSNALIAHQLAEFAKILSKTEYQNQAKKIINWVISKQDTDGGWFYSPDSHLGKDNFHNGYVLWALMRYWEITQNQKVLDSIKKGLKFYRSLFEDDGMPIFSNEKKYPIDIHNCSQGIITFKETERLNLHKEGFYDNILDWTIENMWDDDKHYFYYQKHRLWTNKIPYMRWSQAWMAYALSGLLLND